MTAIQQLRHHFLFLLFCTACGFTFPALATQPDERDRQVLETLLLHLLADSEFHLTRVVSGTNGATIILHERTPKKAGFLMSHQIDDREIPSDAENDLRRRNIPGDVTSSSYDSAMASYTNLAFATGIVVTNLTMKRSFPSFEDAHPKARGWLEAYLPGYTKDGARAVVRADVGPWEHGAMLTAVLEKRHDKWAVVWYHIALFV